MKKLMALLVALTLALTLCAVPALAAGVPFSDIANGQPQNFVVADLNLGSHSITSSDASVIALDGTVSRPLFEDKVVTITVDGDSSYDVTVKAQTVDVKDYYDFTTAGALGTDTYASWKLGSQATSAGNATAVKNGALNANIVINGDGSRTNVNYSFGDKLTADKPYTFAFDISNIKDLTSAGVDIRLDGAYYDAEGNNLGQIPASYIARMNTTAGFTGAFRSTTSKSISFKFDPLTGQVWENGVLAAKTLFNFGSTAAPETAAKVVVNSVYFCNAGGGCKGVFDVDNFVVYQDKSSEEILASASPADKAGFYAKYLAKDYVLNGNGGLSSVISNLKFTADEELISGVELAWTSTDSSLIAADGTVNRPFAAKKTATITGTVSVDGTVYRTQSYDVTVLPLTVGGSSEIVDFDSYNLANGAAVSSAGWTVDSAVKVTNIVDGTNRYAKINAVAQAYGTMVKYNFQNFPSSTERYYILKFKFKNEVDPSAVANIGLELNGKFVGKFIWRANNYGMYGSKFKGGGSWYDSPDSTYTFPTPREFTELMIKVDKVDETVGYYVNGVLKSTAGFNSNAANDKESKPSQGAVTGLNLNAVTSAALRIDLRNDSASTNAEVFYLDDLSVYTEAPLTTLIPTLSDSDKVRLYKEHIAVANYDAGSIGSTIQLNAGYADYDPATYGVSVNWTSSDADTIGNDGLIKKLAPVGTEKTVNMTATVTAGGVTDSIVIPVTIADGTQLITSTDFSDTSESVGSASYTTDDKAHGSVITLQNTTDGSHRTSGSISSITGAGRTDRVVFNADLKYTGNSDKSSGGIGIKTYAGRNGINIMFNFRQRTISANTTIAEADPSGTKTSVNNQKNVYFAMPDSVAAKEGQWVNLTVDHNVLSQTYHIYVDGILLNEIPLLQADMQYESNGGSAIRGYSLELSSSGTIFADNISLKKFTDGNLVEVNAALNAALVDYASDIQKPVLTGCTLPAMTIGKSWVSGTQFVRDLGEDSKPKVTNPSTYKYVSDGPAVTFKVNDSTVTSISANAPKTVQFTVSAAKDGYTESLTVARKIAPIAIRSLGLNGTSALNGAWIEGAIEGDEKLLVANYNLGKLVSVRIFGFDEASIEYKEDGVTINSGFNQNNNVMQGLATLHPASSDSVDAVKIYIFDGDGVTPLAFCDDSVKD